MPGSLDRMRRQTLDVERRIREDRLAQELRAMRLLREDIVRHPSSPSSPPPEPVRTTLTRTVEPTEGAMRALIEPTSTEGSFGTLNWTLPEGISEFTTSYATAQYPFSHGPRLTTIFEGEC